MSYIKKYSLAIIGILLFLLTCKSCQSCSRARTIEWNRMEYIECTDSLNREISDLKHKCLVSEDSIKVLNTEINALREMNGMMSGSLDHARATNKSLIKTINKDKNKN